VQPKPLGVIRLLYIEGGNKMKRCLSALAVQIFSSLGLLACSSRPSQIYDANGITFNYPQNWEVISPSQLSIYVTDYTYLAVLADKDDSTGTMARFVIVQTAKTFDDYIAEERGYYQKQYNDQYSENTTNVNGVPATQFEAIGSALSGDKKKSLSVYFEHNHKLYYLTFTTLLPNYDGVKPDFDMAVNSFKIK
jgi:hypothetical protein